MSVASEELTNIRTHYFFRVIASRFLSLEKVVKKRAPRYKNKAANVRRQILFH